MKPLLLFKSDQFSSSASNFCLRLDKYIQIAMAELPVYSWAEKILKNQLQNYVTLILHYTYVLEKM